MDGECLLKRRIDMYNDNLEERYALAIERIGEIASDSNSLSTQISEYFVKTAKFIVKMDELKKMINSNVLKTKTIEELSEINKSLYADVSGDNYEISYANPAYAIEKAGESYGRILSFLYMEIRAMIVYAYEKREFDMTIVAELFVEIYCMFASDENPKDKELCDSIYWFISDYSDITVEYRLREMLDVNLSFATDIIKNADLKDLRYLYEFGEYITNNEIKMAQYLNSLPQSEIEAMARTFTEGYRIGFVLGNKDISKKKIVNIRYCIGFERVVREEIRQFEAMGLQTTIYRAAVSTINKRMHLKNGYYATSPNKQMDYDHRFDNALYMDHDFMERKLGALRLAYEKCSIEASQFGGPAVMEIFGETPFEPKNKKAAFQLDARQQKLSVRYNNEAAQITNRYIKGEERSFTIIAYPVPDIGENFEEIFREIVKINTLDYEKYKVIQQNIIDALDGANYVEIKGQNGNQTDMKVKIMHIDNPAKQTVFENCLADVNIPLGEVFTSPVLAGTQGVLNVSEVYLNELKYKNLYIRFQDGMVEEYTCDNFEDEDKNKSFIRENLLFNHEKLPLGEFAVGTNTTAYVMANKYDIVYKLPILIAEKMGPHFAIGDTCYSWCEDTAVFNPNGKEIISRDNEITVLRKIDSEKAYFNCHTDITIPYEEIGSITSVKDDGTRIDIIRDARFVLPGTEELNKPFEEDKNKFQHKM